MKGSAAIEPTVVLSLDHGIRSVAIIHAGGAARR